MTQIPRYPGPRRYRQARDADGRVDSEDTATWERSGRIQLRADINQPSTRAALTAAGAAAVMGAVLAGFISAIPNIKVWWLLPVVVVVGLILIIPAALIFQRSVRTFVLHDPSREITGYSYNLELGYMRKGSIDHVALRVEAVHTILGNLIKHIPEEERKAVLYDSGYTVGETWVRDFLKEYALVGKEKVYDEYPALFEQWSYYDATAGFGRFSIAVSNRDQDGNIMLYNSFLSRYPSEFPLNHYLSGYIAGTLNALWSKDKGFQGKRAVVELRRPSTAVEKMPTFEVRIVPAQD